MGRNTTIIPHAPVSRILKSQGNERISDKATKVLSEYLEGYARDVAKRSVKLCEHSGRMTVLDSDVRLAAKR